MNVYIPSENITDMRGPAPSGFHVPLSTEWQAIYDAYTGLGLSGGTNFSTYLKMPMAGNRGNDKTVSNVGSYGYYWSSSPSDDGYRSKVIYFYSSSIYPQSNYYRSYGRSVRCLKNSPAVPTSYWTTLYQGSGSAGIFHNATLGLISISSDGNTWLTIADKNLGATTVYNYGDTLTDANCGNVFQWGNNYAFPGTLSSDSITSSSTQVDASTYGPGNYYSSSTWITAQTWDNSNNGNLRGGETGPFKMNELKNAYIGEVWTPNASRTLLYLPLASDVSDQSGNTGRTFSTSGLTYTTVGGVQSVHIGTTGGIKLTSPSPLVDNNTAHQTISLLFYVTSATSTSRRSLLQFWIPSKTCTLMILSENTTNIHVGGISSGSDLDAAFTANTWNHVVQTNGSNGKKLYLNGHLISSGTGSSTPRGMASSENGQVLFNDRNGITRSQGLNGNAREVILENVEWSAEDVTNYYNQIKQELGF